MDDLQSTLREIELCKDEIERVLQDTASSSEDLLLSLKRSVTVTCSHSRKVPFTVGGGAQDGQLIYIGQALGEKVEGQIQPGDILITVNRTNVSGRIRFEVASFLEVLCSANDDIHLEIVPAGEMPTDIREILSDTRWSDLQSFRDVIRDNVYLRTVPFTTRPKRDSELEGEHYHYVTPEEFLDLERRSFFLEYGEYKGHLYGTPRPDNIRAESDMVSDARGPLPPNWEIAYSELGERYFIDHNSGTTQWDDPRDQEALPEGWEQVDDEQHGTFYVDHVNKRTQYDRPTAASCSDNAVALTSFGNHKTNGINYHYQQAGTSSSGLTNGHGALPNGNGNGRAQADGLYDATGHTHNGWQQANGGHGATKGLPGAGARKPPIAPSSMPAHQNGTRKYMEPAGTHNYYSFTTDPAQLRGQLITTRIRKGDKGLGFTLIGNDGNNVAPEFIQIKSIIPNGPAAIDGILHTGDVLVYVDNECMLGASQDDACRIFRSIPVGETVTIQVCRGYPLMLDPTNRIITENVYMSTNFHARSKEIIEIDISKGPKGFGFTITDSLQGQRVKTVLYPDQCPNLLEADVIVEVDGKNVRNTAHVDLVRMLQEYPVGYRTKMLVSRNSPRHRSRTPTAAFRYGEQRATPMPSLAPRSKTPAPAPHRPPKSATIGPAYASHMHNTTMPRTTVRRDDLYENVHKIRPSSTSLGFSSTPNYVPIKGVGAPGHSAGHEIITVNLIRKDGFGFRLVGGLEMGTPLSVGAIIEGGAADLDGRLRERDEIVEIDGKNVEHGRHDYAVELIKHAATAGKVKLVVRRLRDDLPRSTSLANDYADAVNHQHSVYDVHLAKLDHEDFGCTIVSLNHRYIGQVIPDSPADKCGRLQPGDCVLAINGIPTDQMTHQQVINYIKSSGNTITFTIDAAKALPATAIPASTPQSHYGVPQSPVIVPSRYGTLNPPEEAPLISVELQRGAKGFGFSIRGGWEFGQMPLFILRIAEDGPAAANDKLRVGDQLVEINGENTTGMTHERAIELIKENATVRLLVKRHKLPA